MDQEKLLLKDETIKPLRLNLIAILIVMPIYIGLMMLYWILWRVDFHEGMAVFGQAMVDGALIISILIFCFAMHEYIHAWVCFMGPDINKSDIVVGFHAKYMAPYFHCKVPITVKRYRRALMMPTIILGILPAVAGFIYGSALLALIGTWMIVGGVGDFLIVLKLRPYDSETLVLDHPTQIGFQVVLD